MVYFNNQAYHVLYDLFTKHEVCMTHGKEWRMRDLLCYFL